MHIKQITSQSRRDLVALFECEHCGNTVRLSGYDDRHFHRNVIPHMKCKSCGKEAGPGYMPRATRYSDSEIV